MLTALYTANEQEIKVTKTPEFNKKIPEYSFFLRTLLRKRDFRDQKVVIDPSAVVLDLIKNILGLLYY